MRISDWSSDVCSSDLITMRGFARCDRANFAMSRIAQYACLQFFDGRRRALQILGEAVAREQERAGHVQRTIAWGGDIDDVLYVFFTVGCIELDGANIGRSEERRVGKECVSCCRSWCSQFH